MERLLEALACFVRPELRDMQGEERAVCVGDVFGVLYSTPLLVLALIWLVGQTDLSLVAANWPLFAVTLVLMYLSRRLSFFAITEIRQGTFADYSGSVEGLCVWAAALILGPTALWLALPFPLVGLLTGVSESMSPTGLWTRLRGFTLDAAAQLTAGGVALIIYRWLGGSIPIAGLVASVGLLAVISTVLRSLIWGLINFPFIGFFAFSRSLGLSREDRGMLWRFSIQSTVWPLLIDPFAVLAAGLFVVGGYWAFGFFMLGTLLASAVAHRMSDAIQTNIQRSRELERLERLARAILDAPPDASTLSDVLRRHASDMLMYGKLEIRLFPDGFVMSEPAAMESLPEGIWNWLRQYPESFIIRPGETLPWDRGEVASRNLVLAPIINRETGEPLGGIAFGRRWDRGNVSELLPAVQALSAQIASALHGANIYRTTLDIARFKQELALAEEIQNSLLPNRAPDIPGWQAAAWLESAREASGDFFDIIDLGDRRFGLAIADVSGKGVSSALYMALVSTLLKTYASEYGLDPGQVLSAVNRRMLSDSRSGLFATLIYGVLDTATGVLTYGNAGHNPGYLVRRDGIEELGATGIPVGMLGDQSWTTAETTIPPGSALVLYTDGVTDAVNQDGVDYGQGRLADSAERLVGLSAREVRVGLMEDVREFVDGADQEDDMTFLIMVREGERA